MGNLRDSMTEEEWNDMGLAMGLLPGSVQIEFPEKSAVDHPEHYGGEDNPYEVIKIIDAYGWGYEFALGNAVKYILRAGKKTNNPSEDLEKANWYIAHALKLLQNK
jgi:hypothetical protein